MFVKFKTSWPGSWGSMKPLADTHICVFVSIARRRTMLSEGGSARSDMMGEFQHVIAYGM